MSSDLFTIGQNHFHKKIPRISYKVAGFFAPRQMPANETGGEIPIDESTEII